MNKHNVVIILYFMGLSLFITPVYATSYDFETGTLGALESYYIGAHYVTTVVTVTTGSAYQGTYGGNSFYHKTAFDLYSVAGVRVNMTGDNYIDFDFKIIDTWSHASLRHNNTELWTTRQGSYQTLNQGVWQHAHVWIPTTGGTNESVHIGFGSYEYGPPNPKHGYLDNFTSEGFIPPDSVISFYPTLTNETPTHVNFSINENDEDTEYGLFIYRNVSNTSNYIDYVGWFYDEIGSVSIEITEYGANCTYYAKLWGVHVGDIATCEQEYIFNGSIEPFPTPEPTPIITPLPTYTPPPTPIPPDQPNVDNGSLNMTWLTGYYNLVDATANGLFHPIYNMTAYLMMPVNILSSTISGFMTHMQNIFDIATIEILTATSLLNLFFSAIPDKILNVMTYYLVWIVILLIAKGDT